MVIDGKSTTTDHPVTFVSGLFRGSQLNWAALTKEAFAIYMSVKKLLFYLTDAQTIGEIPTQKHAELKSQQLGNGARGFQHPV